MGFFLVFRLQGTQGVAPRQLPPLHHVVLGGAVLRRLQHLRGTARLADDAVVEEGQVIRHDVELVQPGDYCQYINISTIYLPCDVNISI